MILKLENVNKSFGADNILENISFEINEEDKIGLVGVNGAGKSTLLNIITENLYIDMGEITKKNNLTIGYLKQVNQLNEECTINEELKSIFSEIYELKEKLELLQKEMVDYSTDNEKLEKIIKKYDNVNKVFEAKDGYNIEYKINNVLNGLGFKGYDLNEKITKLSGGEKIRLALVKILLKEPQLLILDEPTNHLDFDMLTWLEEYITSYKGAYLIVSHDRYFLDKVCNKIFEIDNSKLYKYKGNYSKFLIQKEEKIKRQELEYEKQQEKIKKLTEFIDKNLAKSASVNGVGTRVKELEKMELIEKPKYDKKIKLKFEYDTQPFKEVLSVKKLRIILNEDKTSEKELYHNINFDVIRGEKIAIIGKNGVGKSTLLKALLNKIKYDGIIKWNENVSIAYFDQEMKNLNLENTVFDEIQLVYPNKSGLEIRNMCAKLLIEDDMVFKKIKELSGANKAKVLFAIIMLKKPNVLILDEPTNHLDYIAKEELNRALKEYTGTIIMVSHDRFLLNNIATKIIEIESGNINVYNGNFDFYINEKKIKNLQNDNKECKAVSLSKEKNIILQAEKKKLASLERKISKCEIEICLLEEKMLSKEIISNYVELSKINTVVEEKKNLLDELYQNWLECKDKIEEIDKE